MTNAAGTVVWNWAYQGNPFGEQAPTSASGYVLNVRFAGQYYAAEAGNVYNFHRNFDPSTGRYLQSDPIGLKGGISTYSYTESNPLGTVDPLGLAGEKYEYQRVNPTPQMLEAEELLTKLATQAANKVDAECGIRCTLPWIRGTLIHSEFKRLVDAQCPQSMYHTEVSYYDHVEVRYGYPGSSRADVVLGPTAAPIAVYDLKTGWGYISGSQANAYGANLPVGTIIAPIYPVGR